MSTANWCAGIAPARCRSGARQRSCSTSTSAFLPATRSRFFGDLVDVPHHVVTQGIGTILDARHLVLIAIGEGKAEPLARAVEGPLASMCPASAIQLHPRATVVVDEAAAAQLTLADYYRSTFDAKPGWQSI